MFISRKQANDPVFGELRHQSQILSHSFWQGKVYFAPVEKEIDVQVVAKKTGVAEAQRDFFRNLKEKYNELEPQIIKFLVEIIKVYHGDQFVDELVAAGFFDGQFELEGLLIPSFTTFDDEWGLSFYFRPWDQSYTVFFLNWKPVYGKLND